MTDTILVQATQADYINLANINGLTYVRKGRNQ